MKKLFFAMLLFCAPLIAQSPTQIKQVLPTATTQVFNWDYNVTDEASIDDFVIQRTAFAATSTITSPYAVETVISSKQARAFTFTFPSLTAGQKAFFRLIARKVGLADSVPSNILEVDVVATPPGPTNFRFP